MARQRLPAAERRKQILQAAVVTFAQHGYRGATTKRIAAEAGVAEALIYRYFGSKRSLFAEAVDNMARHLLGGLEALFARYEQRPLEALGSMLDLYEQTLGRHRDLAKMIFIVSAELDDPEVRDVYLPHQRTALRLIAKGVGRWQELGFVRGDIAPHSIAWLFLGTFQALALMKHAGEIDRIDIKEALRLAQPFLLGGGAPPAHADAEA